MALFGRVYYTRPKSAIWSNSGFTTDVTALFGWGYYSKPKSAIWSKLGFTTNGTFWSGPISAVTYRHEIFQFDGISLQTALRALWAPMALFGRTPRSPTQEKWHVLGWLHVSLGLARICQNLGHPGYPNLLFKMLTFAIILFSRLFTHLQFSSLLCNPTFNKRFLLGNL